MQKITPCLWFDTQAEEAMNYYLSIFKNSKRQTVSYYGDGGPKPKGTVLVAKFQIEGQEFLALNGGPEFKFNPAISLVVNCENQGELDDLWEKLSKGGQKGQCGWLTDKYGISWQIVPSLLNKMVSDPDPAKAQRVIKAIMPMGKIEMEKLMEAYNG